MYFSSSDFPKPKPLIKFQGPVPMECSQPNRQTFLRGGFHHSLKESSPNSPTLPLQMDHQLENVDVIRPVFNRRITAGSIITQNDVEFGLTPIIVKVTVLIGVIPRAKLRDHHVTIRAMMRLSREFRVRSCRRSSREPHELMTGIRPFRESQEKHKDVPRAGRFELPRAVAPAGALDLQTLAFSALASCR